MWWSLLEDTFLRYVFLFVEVKLILLCHIFIYTVEGNFGNERNMNTCSLKPEWKFVSWRIVAAADRTQAYVTEWLCRCCAYNITRRKHKKHYVWRLEGKKLRKMGRGIKNGVACCYRLIRFGGGTLKETLSKQLYSFIPWKTPSCRNVPAVCRCFVSRALCSCSRSLHSIEFSVPGNRGVSCKDVMIFQTVIFRRQNTQYALMVRLK